MQLRLALERLATAQKEVKICTEMFGQAADAGDQEKITEAKKELRDAKQGVKDAKKEVERLEEQMMDEEEAKEAEGCLLSMLSIAFSCFHVFVN